MEKRTECEIIEDLLLGYVDGVLNMESKKLVDKHLVECENCQSRLNDIKNDIKENENNQKKQVDYLKKVRRKNRLKSIFMACGIIFSILFIIYIRNFIIFNNVLYKAKQSLASNNMYIEMAGNFLNLNNTSKNGRYIRKQYFKDGKYKEVNGILSDEGFKILDVAYTSVNSEEKITFVEDSKKVRVEKYNTTRRLNDESNLKSVPSFVRDDRIIIRIVLPAIMSVESKENIPISSYDKWNKSCYRFKDKINEDESGSKEIWIDKETGLPLKIIEKESMGTLFVESDIVKEVRDNVSEYRYEFNTVIDKDVEIPNFDGYEIEYVEY